MAPDKADSYREQHGSQADAEAAQQPAADDTLRDNRAEDPSVVGDDINDGDGWRDLTEVLHTSELSKVNTSSAGGSTRQAFGRFALLAKVGRGGCGVVYQAHDPDTDRVVALKIPRDDFGMDEFVFERIQREAKIVAGLEHAGIMPVYEAGQLDGVGYIVSQFCPGPDLGKWLQTHHDDLTPRQAAQLVADLAEALDYAHRRGVVHRDVKPGNVLLQPLGDDNTTSANDTDELPFVPRLTDFGLARMQSDEWSQTRTSMVIGTPLYMAPECFSKESGKWAAACDTYALGALFYQLLTGAPPIQGGDGFGELLDRIRHERPPLAHEVNDRVPTELSVICNKCLAKEPSGRYETAAEMAQDIRRFLRGDAIRARVPNLWDHFLHWCAQPQRITQAGTFTCWYHLLTIAWLSISIVGAGIFRLVAFDHFMLNVIDLAIVAATVHLPKAWLGWQVVRGRRWAFWPSAIISLLCLVMFIVALTGESPFFKFNHPTVLSKVTSFVMMIGASLVETVLYGLAIRAFGKSRR